MSRADAIEAVARALAVAPEGWEPNEWDSPRIDDSYRETFRAQARMLLESDAPLLLAQGWDDAAAWVAKGHPLAPGAITGANPYRTSP